ncbi:MAG: hypothetical protein U1E27_09905, partial [Kiritimatiellia bacterium]|nr:hypothetical protein [Kiritimatiellia bacterium]
MNAARHRAPSYSAVFWFAALLLSASWHLLWGWMPASPPRRIQDPVSQGARLEFFTRVDPSSERQAPILFTLNPTGETGTGDRPSRPLRAFLAASPPPPKTRLPELPPIPVAVVTLPTRAWNHRLPAPEPEIWTRPPPPKPPRSKPGIEVEFLAGWNSDELHRPEFDNEWITTGPWEARVWLRFDDSGFPIHALIDATDLSPELRMRIRKTLHSW